MSAAKRARPGQQATRQGSRTKRWAGWVAGGLVTALVVTLAVVSQGFDSRETPREEPSVWVERSAGQYARVNTETAEIDTVRLADNPSAVVQSGALGVLLTQGYGRAWVIDPAAPKDVVEAAPADAEAETSDGADDDAAAGERVDSGAGATEQAAGPERAQEDEGDGESLRTPEGTRSVTAAGGSVLFTTENGSAYLSRVSDSGAVGAPMLLDPLAGVEDDAEDEDAERERYRADAAALDERGRVALYSATEHSVRWYDSVGGEFRRAQSSVPEAVPAAGVQLTIVDGSWAIFDPESGKLWREGAREPVELEISGTALLQGPSATGDAVYVADEAGLLRSEGSGDAERIVDAAGLPAQPQTVSGDAIAAWLGVDGAKLWSSEHGEQALELDPSVEDLSTVEPEIRSNGSRALVVDRLSGMMWTVPDGTLIPVEQWTLIDPPKQETGVVITQDVTEQEPPVAVDDAFGVRAGETVILPVLLNDYDPNRKDVLTVVSEGLGEGLSEGFGELSMTSDGQALTIRTSPSAQGSTAFSYRVTDGVNLSPPATVTLTVAGDDTNTAPAWCPVEGCQRTWPSPELAPGGTLILPVLEGWVDPEGDPMMLADATPTDPADPVRALVTADGKLAVRHTDANAESADIGIRLRIVDSRGAEAERDLRLRIRPGAAMEFASMALTAKTGEVTGTRPLERVTGGSGSFQLVDAVVQQGGATVTAHTGRGTLDVLAEEAGGSLVSVTVRDALTEQEITGVLRITAVDSRPPLGIPPLRAFVRPLADTTVDVLQAIPGANSRALTVQSAEVESGQLRADVIEHARVRVSGSTHDGQPGRIGTVDVVIAEGSSTTNARMTVFQVAEGSGGAIAVADTATVRAGSVVDIPVLENDVAPPGERLVLHPEVGAPGIEGELAFASGSNVRYLAPKQPGTYTLSYTTYGASSPESRDVGQVRVVVLPEGANRDPQPATVTVRVAPGEQARATIPLSGVDPDGDRVRLVSVDAPEDPQLTASILPRTGVVLVEASKGAERGTRLVDYRVRDAFGGEATGRLRIIVTEPDPGGGAPIVYSDYVRIQRGSTDAAAVRPLDNDIDPSGGTLELVSVEPNVPGGEGTELWKDLESRLDLSELKRGVVRITGDELGTVSYRYTVRSSKSTSTADGLIVVQVSERVGQQAPSVIDTVLSVRDRTELAENGVDVVTDRVRWASGDAQALTLSLWKGAQGSYEVHGNRISGAYRSEGDLVPFKLSGVDMTGAEVQTFGFMVVPPLDELRLTLKPGLAPLSVEENKSVDASLADLLDLGPGDRAELASGGFSVQRGQASCQAVNSTTIRYTAGKEAPWNDSCTIRVRLSEQRTYTSLPVPVNIVPNEPVVELTPLTRTIAPGQEETISLADMVQWQGGRQGDLGKLRWQAGAGGGGFETTQSGASVTAVARADAVPGSQIVIPVTASGSGESQAALTLRVGEAPADTPRGGTVALQCTVGSDCSVPLIGAPGEYDPFAGRSGGGLELVSVDGGSCSYGTLQASGNSVRASWPDPRGPGGKCTAGFTVRDAQKRIGTGTIEFDAQGVPRAPAAISLAAYTENSVTLEVSLGEAANAHPAVTGVVVNQDGGGATGSCSASGATYRCTVGGLAVGDKHRFTARAVNGVGESDPTANAAEGWAFELPRLRSEQITVEQRALGEVRVSVAAGDATVGTLRVQGGGASGSISGAGGDTVLSGVAAGEQVAFSVTPVSQYAPPIAGVGQDGQAATKTQRIIGQVQISGVSASSENGSSEATVTFALDSGFDPEVTWGVRTGHGSCSPSQSGSPQATVNAAGPYRNLDYTVCAKNRFSDAQVTGTTWVGGQPPALQVNQGYSIGGAPSGTPQGATWEWTQVVSQPSYANLVYGAELRYHTGGSVLESVGVGVVPSVQQCVGSACSSPGTPLEANGPPSTSLTKSPGCIDPNADVALSFTQLGRSDAPTFRVVGTTVYAGWSGWGEAEFAGAICEATPGPETPPETP